MFGFDLTKINRVLFSAFVFCGGLFFSISDGVAQKVELSADNGLEWDLNKRTIIAKENASLIRDGMNIISDKIAAYYNEKNGKREIYEITAMGNVLVNSEAHKIHSDYLTYDMKNSFLTLSVDEGKDRYVKMESGDTILLAKGDVVFYQLENKIILKDAKVLNSNRVIEGDLMYVFLGTPKGAGKSSSSLELKRVLVKDGITIKDGDQLITGNVADFNQETGVANISGGVKFSKGEGASLTGGKIHYNMRTGIAKVLPSEKNGKVKGVFSSPE